MSASRRIVVSMDDQSLDVFEGSSRIATFEVSTAGKGMGFAMGSHRTPTGRFLISGKIGDGHPSGTIFRARKPAGIWRPDDPCDGDLVLTRILRLDGIDDQNRNTRQRFIYIHGTNDEHRIGQPAGHGCVRLRNADMIALHDMVRENDEVEILPATRRRGKLAFIAFDSVLVAADGIVELAGLRGSEIRRASLEIHNTLEAGAIDLAAAYRRWMDLIQPDDGMLRLAGERCLAALAAGAGDFIRTLETSGWLPVMWSRSPMELVHPVAKALGIRHIEAPVADSAAPSGYRYPCTGHLSKVEVVRDWSAAMLPRRTAVIGHGRDDMETRPAVDVLAAVGTSSPQCDVYIRRIDEAPGLLQHMEDPIHANHPHPEV